jgi:phosphoglycolate phosphatase
VVGHPRLFCKGKALKRIPLAKRLERADVLYVRAEARDVEAAKMAGVKVAAVAWVFQTADLLGSCAPDQLVTTPAALLELLDGGEVGRAAWLT